jgi:hypothetical protein
MPGSDRQRGQRRRERAHHAGHRVDRAVHEHVQLLVGFVGVGEEARPQVHHQLVAERGRFGHLAGAGICDNWNRVDDVERLPGVRGNDRPRRLE